MRPLVRSVLLFSLILCLGCPPPAAPPPPTTLLEWFKQKMADVETPEGAIEMDSVQAEGEDTILYETTKDGVRKKWKAKFQQTGEGEYSRVGELEEVAIKE